MERALWRKKEHSGELTARTAAADPHTLLLKLFSALSGYFSHFLGKGRTCSAIWHGAHRKITPVSEAVVATGPFCTGTNISSFFPNLGKWWIYWGSSGGSQQSTVIKVMVSGARWPEFKSQLDHLVKFLHLRALVSSAIRQQWSIPRVVVQLPELIWTKFSI